MTGSRSSTISRTAILGGIVLGLAAFPFAAERAAAQQSTTQTPATSPQDRQQPQGSTTPRPPEQKPQGFTVDDNGINYQLGDFKWTGWGYFELMNQPIGGDYFRRFRQGSEFDFPRITPTLRPALVYEVDLTDTNFLANGVGGRNGLGRRNLENLFFAIQDANDPNKIRALIGENTHILSREDNLSSGNLPTLNRSLILEEHGTVHTFGSQFGVEFGMALSPAWSFAVAALDNQGSFNAEQPHYSVGNSLSAKVTNTAFEDKGAGQKLVWGAGIDNTFDVRHQTFGLLTAVAQAQLGSVPVNGDKLSLEGDVAYTFPSLFARPTTIEAEGIFSRFDGSRTNVGGGYAMIQYSLFDKKEHGDLDLFARYDFVDLKTSGINSNVFQQAMRAGFNYNLPYIEKRVNFRIEYAHNTVRGPADIITVASRSSDEFRAELRFSLQPYIRH